HRAGASRHRRRAVEAGRLCAVRRSLDGGGPGAGGDGLPRRPGVRGRAARRGPGPDLGGVGRQARGHAVRRGTVAAGAASGLRLSRGALFGFVCAGLALLGAGYVGYVALRAPPSSAATSMTTGRADPALRGVLDQAHLVFLQPSGGDPTQDVVAVAPLEQGTGVRLTTGLRCQRTY